ncbi:hypothetical protein [Martelella soudanensis]|uniref:hypothetical protein n=1 Tax=unclassified Martelella TaxID=2629616 RepID=UPI0015DE7744|nr:MULTISPECIES: hypothetical protein [unclassified Martelella]
MTTDLSPRPDCPLGDGCGYGFCRECHWGELSGLAHVCGRAVAERAEEERCDRAAMMALEGAFGWRSPEQFVNENRKEKA